MHTIIFIKAVMNLPVHIYIEHRTSLNVYTTHQIWQLFSVIGTNHTKTLAGLKDGRLCNKLVKSKAKKWTNMSQVLQDIANMAINFKRACGYSLPTFEVQYISSNMSNSSFRPHRQSTKIYKIQLT